MKKVIISSGVLAIVVLGLFLLSKYSFLTTSIGRELRIAIPAVLFLSIGFYLSRRWTRPRTERIAIPVKTPVEKSIDQRKIQTLGISPREYEVLESIAKGLSNKEIAGTLFISETTVKSHVSSLLLKLDAKRRTEAVKIAREIGIL